MTLAKTFDIDINKRSLLMLLVLGILPNLIGAINLPTIWGFKIHLFQIAIFVSAAMYGPVGGMISGGLGSTYTAMMLGNPYIIIGNIILGTFTGILFRKGFDLILSVIVAYLIQLPFLWITDVYIIGMPSELVTKIVIALLISNIFWAVIAKYSYPKIKEWM